MKLALSIIALSIISLFSFTIDANTASPEPDMNEPVDSMAVMFGDFSENRFVVYTNENLTNLNMQFNLIKDSKLECFIYNEADEVVKKVDFGFKKAGKRHIVIEIDELEDGVYKAQLSSEGLSISECFEILH